MAKKARLVVANPQSEEALFRRHAVHVREAKLSCTSPPLTMRSQRDGQTHVVQLIGELDRSNAHTFDDELKRVEATDARRIIVDLSGLEFIGSDGLKAFIQANARSRQRGNRLLLVRGPDQLHKTFETTGLASLLPFIEMDELIVQH